MLLTKSHKLSKRNLETLVILELATSPSCQSSNHESIETVRNDNINPFTADPVKALHFAILV